MWVHHLVFILSGGAVFTFCDMIKANEFLPNRGALERYEVSAAAAERSNETLACYERLRKTAYFAARPVISEPAECAVHDLVQLDRIIMEDGSEVSFSSAPILRCGMAEAVTEWIRNDVGALATALGAPLRMIANFDSYQCRSRNRVSGAQPSEHGKCNALDVGAITLRNGATFSFVDVRWRGPSASRCAPPLATVLRPFWAPGQMLFIKITCIWTSGAFARPPDLPMGYAGS